eukprot:399151_1
MTNVKLVDSDTDKNNKNNKNVDFYSPNDYFSSDSDHNEGINDYNRKSSDGTSDENVDYTDYKNNNNQSMLSPTSKRNSILIKASPRSLHGHFYQSSILQSPND